MSEHQDSPLFVFGHRNPDTDAICAAVAYADFLKQTTRPDAIAASCGPPNRRTEYVLKVAELPAPRLVMDIRPVIEDVCRHDVTSATSDEVFFEVYQRMDQFGLRSIPVMTCDGKLDGIVSLLDLLELVLNSDMDSAKARYVTTNLREGRLGSRRQFPA